MPLSTTWEILVTTADQADLTLTLLLLLRYQHMHTHRSTVAAF